MTEVAESARPPRRFRRYPEYKSSGVAWLGDLPSHWKPKRFKFACSRSALYGANESAESYSLDGIRFLRTTDIDDSGSLVDDGAVYLPEELVQDYLLSDGDILISRSGTLGRALHYQRDVHGPCAYAGYLVRFVPKPTLDPRFAFYFTKSKVFMGWLSVSAIQSTIGNINGQKYGNLHLSDPALGEQRAIADFLDRETARIDQLIEKKQRMVEVLEEKLAAQLQYTVLAGAKLSRNPEGDWLSDLSNDWRLFPIKHMVRIVGGATPSKEREDYWIGPIPWVSPKDMKRDTISATAHCISEMALANSPVSIVPKGAVLIVVRGMILARLVPVCRLGCNATINQDMKALTSRGNIISNHYLHRMLQGFQDVIMSFVDEAAHGTKTLRSDRFFSLKFPVPPFELQTNLVVEYDKQKRLMDAIIEKIESSIYRLREFRSALITAAVTGQIDVSTWSKKGMTERRFDQIEEATSA